MVRVLIAVNQDIYDRAEMKRKKRKEKKRKKKKKKVKDGYLK